jgi:hypothetical protein
MLGTGYKMTFPFLPDSLVQTSLPPTPIPPIPKDKLYNSTYHITPLLEHLFPVTDKYPPTSLAFLGLLFGVSPFPVVEAQSHAVVKLWTSPELLDVDLEVDVIISRYERFDHIIATRSPHLHGPHDVFAVCVADGEGDRSPPHSPHIFCS